VGTGEGAAHELGQTDSGFGISGVGPLTTVHDFADPFPARTTPPTGTRWAGLDIETCYGGWVAIAAEAEAWELVDADGDHLTVNYTRSDVSPREAYPHFKSVADGDCVRGWALWALPAQFTPVTALRVDHEGRNGQRRDPEVAWTLDETP